MHKLEQSVEVGQKQIPGLYTGSSYQPGTDSTMDNWITEWRSHAYPNELRKRLLHYDVKQELGDRVLDIGSGPEPISFSLRNPKKIILIDVVPMVCSLECAGKEVTPIWANVEILLKHGHYADVVRKHGAINTVIASSILNYLDWKELISAHQGIHAPGGYLFIANLSNRGVQNLFSEHRPQNHLQIVNDLPNYGYKVIEQDIKNKLGIIVAKKD